MYDSNHLTYTIDLDYVNVEIIQNYISVLNLLIEIENKKKIQKSTRKVKIADLLTVAKNDDDNDDVSLQTQAENPPSEQSEDRDLSNMTKAEISALCKAKNIKVLVKDSKNDLIKKLSA
jgi:hypothetical protein